MAADAEAVSAIPPGVLVTWAQRNDQVMVGVELPGCTSAECDFADGGVVQLTRVRRRRRGDAAHAGAARRDRRGRLHLARRRPRRPARAAEAQARRVDRLLAGEKLANVRIDWGQWMDAQRRRRCAQRHAAPPPPRAHLHCRRRPELSACARRAADSRQPDRPRRLPMRGAMGAAAAAPSPSAAPSARATAAPRAGKDWGSNVQSGLDARQQRARSTRRTTTTRTRRSPCASRDASS